MFIQKMLAHNFSNWSGIRDQKFITCYWDLSYCSIVKYWVRKSILIFVAYFFKGEAVLEPWNAGDVIACSIRCWPKQGTIWRHCWNVFDRVSWWYCSQKKTSLTVTCLPTNPKIKIYEKTQSRCCCCSWFSYRGRCIGHSSKARTFTSGVVFWWWVEDRRWILVLNDKGFYFIRVDMNKHVSLVQRNLKAWTKNIVVLERKCILYLKNFYWWTTGLTDNWADPS